MGFTFPNAAEAFWQLMDGTGVTPMFHLTVDFAEQLPVAHIVSRTPQEDFITRTDRVQVDLYGEGDAARDAAEAFCQRVTGTNLTVPGVGLLDQVVAELAPHELPYPSDRINVFSAVYRVTTRPKS